jgi:hypothetical protein
MVEEFVALAIDPRQEITKFQHQLHDGVRTITGELSGDIAILKERQFDANALKLLAKLHYELIDIIKSLHPDNPYAAAEKLVHVVLEEPSMSIIGRLNSLVKHHLETTNIAFKVFPSVELRHPEAHSLDKLKTLATHLKDFMTQHPIKPTNILHENMQDVPAFTAGKEEATKH